MRQALLVVAKRPAPGQTKTRLTPPLGPEQAAELYECFLRDTLDLMRLVPNVERIIAFAPETESAYFRRLAPDMQLVPQIGASLGERLDHALTSCLTGGFSRAVIMDSDSPTLPAKYIARAFQELATSEVVLGPCVDGGYYLMGLTRPQPRLLREVQLSTPHVLQDTLRLAKSENLTVSLTPEWYDVDTREELVRLYRELSGSGAAARHTRAYLQNLGQDPSPIRHTIWAPSDSVAGGPSA